MGAGAGTVRTVPPPRPRRSFDEIIAHVHDQLRRGRLRPGDRLPAERALAEQFAVSRNTVREALRVLEISGVIEMRRGASGGAYIAAADPDQLATSLSDMVRMGEYSFSDLTEARRWIHTLVVRAACLRGDGELHTRLEANVAEAERLSRAGDWEQKALVHVQFHNLLAHGTGNPVLAVIAESLSGVMREFVLAVGPTEDDTVLESRRRLIGFLRARDADAAVAEMQQHQERIHALWMDGCYRGSRAVRSRPEEEASCD